MVTCRTRAVWLDHRAHHLGSYLDPLVCIDVIGDHQVVIVLFGAMVSSVSDIGDPVAMMG